MSADPLFPVPPAVAQHAHVDEARYQALYQASISDPDRFWAEQARRIDWMTAFTQVKQTSFDTGQLDIQWFAGGQLNVSANCLDRHLAERAEQTAIIWEADEPGSARHISYRQLHTQVCRFANVLKQQGVRQGYVVTLYITRIGAIHSVVFGGFSPEALSSRSALPGAGDGQRSAAVHSLHFGLHRSAQGNRAYHCRLPSVRCAYPRDGFRLPARRDLLVHGRCGLDHRTQLYGLWPAGQRLHQRDVRRRAQLPGYHPHGTDHR